MSWRRCLFLSIAALALVVVAEAAPALIWQVPAADAAATPPLHLSSNPAAFVAETDPADDIAAILARPVFSPSRRPKAAPVEVADAPAIAPPPATLPRLTGVVTSPGDRLALFAVPEGKVAERAEGEMIGAYVVRSIAPNQVVLVGPDGERALHTSLLKIVPHVIHAVQESSATP